MQSGILNKPSFVFYTLHHKATNIPYVVHIKNKEEQYKTTLVSLLHKKDILYVGTLLEYHKEIKGVYPDNTFDYNTLFRLKINSNTPIASKQELGEFNINRWNQERLMNYCVEHWLDLMIIETLEDAGTIQVVEFDIPRDYLIERLNKSLL